MSIVHGRDDRYEPLRLEQLFERQALRTPSACAATVGGARITYEQLDTSANTLAFELLDRGAATEKTVAVCVPRSLELLVTLLGVLKTGASYLALDPAYPQERLDYMLQQSRVQIGVATPETASVLSRVPKIVEPVAFASASGRPVAPSPPTLNTIAYTIYTSGSTGLPNAVALTHRSATSFVSWAVSFFGADRLRTVIASTSASFDLSVFEMFAPLACGGTAVIVRDLFALEEDGFPESPHLINTVPSILREFLKETALPASTAVINLAGEALPPTLARTILDRGIELFNLYGPTESTTYSTAHRVTRKDLSGDSIPIGRPISLTTAFVVDDRLHTVPRGTIGELCLSGEGIARGYHSPRITADRFVPSIDGASGQRMYRSGDLVRIRSDDVLEYVGRADEQVKIRGFRIEPREVEVALEKHPLVDEAVVVAVAIPDEPQTLSAFVVAKGDATLTLADIRGFLRPRIPSHLIPTRVWQLSSIPRTPNGKVDRRGLGQSAGGDESEQDSDLLESIRRIWSEVLGVPKVKPDDNFFDLGGHSLAALRIRARIGAQLDLKMPVSLLFDAPSPRALANALRPPFE